MPNSSYSFQLNIVSAEAEIFSGSVIKAVVRGTEGDIGIVHGHAPLLTELIPATLTLTQKPGKEEFIYIAGGVLEIQPYITTVLADVAVRAEDIDEKQTLKAKQKAQRQLEDKSIIASQMTEIELIRALAQLRTISKYRKSLG